MERHPAKAGCFFIQNSCTKTFEIYIFAKNYKQHNTDK